MVSVTDSMQVTKETLRMRKQCVPGALSDFSNALERGYVCMYRQWIASSIITHEVC